MTLPVSEPSIAAVILNWRDPTRTDRCARQLEATGLVDSVVLVDGESTGELRGLSAALQSATLIEVESNTGFAAGVNVGLRKVLDRGEHEYVLVINNDATIDTPSLALLVAELNEDQSLAMVGPRSVDSSGLTVARAGRLNRWTWAIDEDASGDEIDYLTWACVLIRASALSRYGLLDERFFMYWEDVDFGLRLKDAGARFALVDGATLVHEVSSSHSRAGARISAYSSAAFVHFLSQHGGRTRFVGLMRLTLKWAREQLSGRREVANAIVVGARIGRAPENPVYPQFNRVRL